MKIQNNHSDFRPNFGIKVSTKTAIEAATGCFLENAKISYPRQIKLLSQVGNINTNNLYVGEISEGLRNMSKVIRKRHPEIANAAEKIREFCQSYNLKRTFLPEDEVIFNKKLSQVVENEIKTINKKEINITPMSLEDLGLDKLKNYINKSSL